ncbi:MAG: glycosyltransferase [Thermoguttaceae bacterium]
MFPDHLAHPTILPLPVALPPATITRPVATETIGALHLVNGEHYAGAERVQDLLAQRLPELGYSVGFVCVKPGSFDAMRTSRDAPLWNVPMLGKFDLRAGWQVARLVRRHGYRLLHAHTVRTALFGSIASALAEVPLVYHVHSPTARNHTGGWRDRVNAAVERMSLRRAARIIAVSEAMGEHIVGQGLDPDRVTVVPNGVPQLESLPARPRPAGSWTLGMVALFRPRKGVEVLLEAIALLHRYGLPVQLNAVGQFESPRYEAEIKTLVDRLNLNERIHWTGFRHDVAAELRRMDLLALPSLFGEGLPMVVLEAMAAGVPVVATRVEGVPEAIRHGIDGVLARAGDAEDLARAIADVIAGRYDWSALRRSARARQVRLFSDRSMATGVARVYNGLFAAGPHVDRQ